MKLSALNGFARVNPTDTINKVDLQGHTPGHTDMNAVPVGMIVRKAKRKLGKASRKEKRQARREERRARREQRQMENQTNFYTGGQKVYSSLDDNNARKKLLAQRIEQLFDRVEKTNDPKTKEKISKLLNRLKTLQGSTNGRITNFMGNTGGTVEDINGFALQGKKEREARRKKRKARKDAREEARAKKKRLRQVAKEKKLIKKAKRRELTGQERRAKRRDERRTRKEQRQQARRDDRKARQDARRLARQERQTSRQEARAERQRQRQEARGERGGFGDALKSGIDVFGDKIADRVGLGGDDLSQTRGGIEDVNTGGGFLDNLIDQGLETLEDETGLDITKDKQEEKKSSMTLPLIIGGGLVGAYLLTKNKKGKKTKRKK